MGAMMRAFDWSRTPIGPVEAWPQSLRTSVSILLESKFPMYIAWGADFTQFYNDSYRPILGSTKHPAALGLSTRETFKEIWNIIGPMFHGVLEGNAVGVQDFLLPLDRHGFVEECYFIFSYSPISDESGRVGGVMVICTETTERVIGERRMKTLRAVATATGEATTESQACDLVGKVLGKSSDDLPFALVYLLDRDGTRARLASAAGLATGTRASPVEIDLAAPSSWPLARVASDRAAVTVDDLTAFGALTAPDGQPPPRCAVVLPIDRPGDENLAGFLVAGTSPRLLLDDKYKSFLDLVAGQIATALGNVRALAEAKARAEALAEIDRAKTAFFSNVSHEFRTPLTLMLGPAHDALASAGELTAADLERWQLVQRNAQRLLKLVNTLLDFSRIEAGRVEAAYEPTDLAALTADLTSQFRAAIERAGLALVVDCPPIGQPVYVDHDMWEKIVLNLLSNALKFTFDGAIEVRVARRDGAVALTVRDSGIGVAPEELPRLFERFHRVQGARSRTHEGSGIGLALVKELVQLHGGEIVAESELGRGTSFTVTLPLGSAHLPKERLAAAHTPASTATSAALFVEEALRWTPDAAAAATATPAPAGLAPAAEHHPSALSPHEATVLLADDNADMRRYVARILAERWNVVAVADGAAALAAARARRPDLVVSDIMMPGFDGVALLRALRADDALRTVPVIFLSARAGDEARVEGLRAGADDYLVKPFSARELVARVESQIARVKIRELEESHARRLRNIFEHAPVGIAVLRGRDHVFEFVNSDYSRLIAKRDVVGKPIRRGLSELAGQGIFELLDKVYTTGEPFIGRSVRLVLNRGPGLAPDECFFDFVYQPMRDDSGEVEGIIVVCFEVTELARARHSAEAANRAKDEFLAILGHELRNPLAPILTALQLMRLRGHDAAERERTIIDRQVQHLVRLVDDLLDVSRVTRGKIDLKRQPADLAEVMAKAIEMTSPLLEEREHQLRVDVPRHRLKVYADPTRLAQVFSNLLANAAKYTEPQGRITVDAAVEGGEVVVAIRDTGVGIAPETLPHVFDLFVQEHQSLDRSRGGLGLGLSIVRSLVQLHGGSVSAHSDGRGRGSTFSVRLPLLAAGEAALTSTSPDPKLPSSPATRTPVLIVDDNRDAAELLAETLRLLGYDAHIAHDGPSGLDRAIQLRPRLVLLDIGLPVMDGYEVARRIRATPELRKTRLVAVTGYGQDSDRARARDAGFDDHVVKPIDIDRLTSIIGDLSQSA